MTLMNDKVVNELYLVHFKAVNVRGTVFDEVFKF